jgi:hypothetical protein
MGEEGGLPTSQSFADLYKAATATRAQCYKTFCGRNFRVFEIKLERLSLAGLFSPSPMFAS